MNIKFVRVLLPCALMLASLPAFAQQVRFITQGSAYAFVDDQLVTERVIDQVIGTPVGEGSQIVFFRPADTRAGKTTLSDGTNSLAELPSNAYYATAVTPGVHTYLVDGNTLQVDCTPGKRSYVRISHGDGNAENDARLVPSQALTFLRTTLGKRPPMFY